MVGSLVALRAGALAGPCARGGGGRGAEAAAASGPEGRGGGLGAAIRACPEAGAVLDLFEQRGAELGCDDVAVALRRLARLGARSADDQRLSSILRRAEGAVQEWNPMNLAFTAWALAKLGLFHRPLLDAIS